MRKFSWRDWCFFMYGAASVFRVRLFCGQFTHNTLLLQYNDLIFIENSMTVIHERIEVKAGLRHITWRGRVDMACSCLLVTHVFSLCLGLRWTLYTCFMMNDIAKVRLWLPEMFYNKFGDTNDIPIYYCWLACDFTNQSVWRLDRPPRSLTVTVWIHCRELLQFVPLYISLSL